MKHLALLAGIGMLAGSAHAGVEVEVEVTGAVVFNLIGDEPLSGVMPGDGVVMSFTVDSDNFMDGVPGDTRGYEIDQSSFSMTFGGDVVQGLLDPFPDGETPYFGIVEGFPVSDGFFVSTSTVSPGGVPLEQEPLNANLSLGYVGETLSSLDILDALGTYAFDGLTSFGFDLWANFPDNVGMAIDFEQMTISAEPPDGGGTFTLIGPGFGVDMTPDGQYVLLTNGDGASIWSEETGIINVGGNEGVAISDDGMIVLAEITDPDTGLNAAGLWTQATGFVSLGGLPGQTGCDANLSNPYDLSGVGDVAVGLGWEGCQGRAFRWTEETGMLALPQIGPNSARANAISGDGMTIGGWDEADNGPRRAAVWFPDGTEQIILEGLPNNAEGLGEVWGFSTDGFVVVGQAQQDIDFGGGFRYIDGVVDIIPALPGTDPFFFVTVGFAVTDDGSKVVGTNVSGFGPFADRNGIIWTEEGGTQVFQDYLVDMGVEIPDGLNIASVEAMSPDGTIFAGWTFDNVPPFEANAFIVTLTQEEPPVEAFLDIRPGSCPNPFNRQSNGVLPTSLLGTEDFDVSEVDLATVVMSRADGVGGAVAPNEGPPGPHSTYNDVGAPFLGDPCDCAPTGTDGFTDLNMKFRTSELVDVLELNGLPPGDIVELVVSGNLIDGTPFAASDCVRLVPVGSPGAQMLLIVEADVDGAWVDVTTPDIWGDAGGFADFVRVYAAPTVVTLSAERRHEKAAFLGWRVNGQFQSVRVPRITLTVSLKDLTVEPVFATGDTDPGDQPIGPSPWSIDHGG
jgi:hypothetical protein